MNEMMSYVFGTLQKNEAALTNVGKALKSQVKLNKSFTLFMVGTAAYVWASNHIHKEQAKKIKELRRDLDELRAERVEEEVDETLS